MLCSVVSSQEVSMGETPGSHWYHGTCGTKVQTHSNAQDLEAFGRDGGNHISGIQGGD